MARPQRRCGYTISSPRQVSEWDSRDVGFSLARQVISEDQPEYFVVELSSFQLDDMHRFRVHIALLMNITPDHLDRYHYDFEEYARAKMRILQNQTKKDAFIYWGEDEYISRYVMMHQPMPMKCLPFLTYPQVGSAADRSDDNVMRLHFDGKHFEIPIDQLALQGPHNLQNAMAASIAALHIGVSPRGAHSCPTGLRERTPPTREGRGARRGTLHQRLQGHQHQLYLLCPTHDDHALCAHPRGRGQGERLPRHHGADRLGGTWTHLPDDGRAEALPSLPWQGRAHRLGSLHGGGDRACPCDGSAGRYRPPLVLAEY